MAMDLTLPCGDGFLNMRVGAIILRDGKFLMVGNDTDHYYYSVGGRIQFGETAQQAVVREVQEETGTVMEIDRLGFIHEDYFYGDTEGKRGKLIYEVSFYFYMKVPEDFHPHCDSVTANGHREYLRWVSPDDPVTLYPAFFRTDLLHPTREIQHRITDERWRIGTPVTVTIDRPIGSVHPKHPEIRYPINYGYVKGLLAPDGEEQDVYILGVTESVETFTGRIIAFIHRDDDVEEKWVAAPEGVTYTKAEIETLTHFQEQFHHSHIRME